MIREYLLEQLTREWGKPLGTVNHEWWIAWESRPGVHICLNQKFGSQDEAHVLVFDPAAVTGTQVVEERPMSKAEADQAIATIRRIVRPDDDSAVADR